ncbi:MAG: thioredoxin family protein [Pirellulales bacterium]|nr:thioredoxin family protein [Pirellulales bacterium]
MRPKAWFLYALVLTLVSTGQAPGQVVAWQSDLQTAQQMAAQSNRLVLIHFGAPWCEACHRMERETLADPMVYDAMRMDFVPVGLNVDHHRALARQYGVNALPTDVIIAPQGQLIDRLVGYISRTDYAARLARIVAATRRPALAANMPGGSPEIAGRYAPPSSVGYDNPAMTTAPAQPFGPPPTVSQPSLSSPGQPTGPRGTLPPWANASTPYPAPAGPALSPGNPTMPPGATSVAGAAPQQPPAPLGLDGYCPVELIERKEWTLGNQQWSTVFAGRTYLFAGPRHLQRFLADPDRYSPVNSGVDVVLQFDRGQIVPGQRRHGVFFGERIFLFACEDSLQAFARDSARYENALRQAAEQARRPANYR